MSLFVPEGVLKLLRGPHYPEAERVIINTKSGTAIRGLLLKHWGRYIVLREAELLQSLGKAPGPKPVPVDGEVLVEHADIDFIQVLR